jgi:endonuclease-3
VGTRVGLIPPKMSVDRAHDLLGHLLPGPDMYPAHIMMVEHGRRFCRPQSPRCDACNLHRWCLRQGRLPIADCRLLIAD